MNNHTQNPPIVILSHGQAVTTTLAIAEGTEVEHKAVIQLVRTYIGDLQEFGRVAFETRPLSNSGFEIQNSAFEMSNSAFETRNSNEEPERSNRGRPTEYALLNQEQATLIMTYMRNSDIVRQFKKRLVKAFFDMARQLNGEAQATAFSSASPFDGIPNYTPFDRFDAGKYAELRKAGKKSLADAYLIDCGITPDYVKAVLAPYPEPDDAPDFHRPGLKERAQQFGSIALWWLDCLDQGGIGEDWNATWPSELPAKAVQSAYADWCRAHHIGYIDNHSRLGKALMAWGVIHRRVRLDSSNRHWRYEFPPLDRARALFSAALQPNRHGVRHGY